MVNWGSFLPLLCVLLKRLAVTPWCLSSFSLFLSAGDDSVMMSVG